MFLCKTTFAENWFWRVAEFDVEMMNLDFCHMHGNLECRLLSSHVHARQQTPNLFQPGFISTTLWTRSFVELVFVFATCERLGRMFLLSATFIFQQRLHGRLFHWKDG